ncbi:hypothetical protein CALCODRAFT_222232 [Calocera cornea HHB12733]|uniref:Uncharacterized protein n=1 Tax=Calocera cornea HHB12733 TaxID=1353952 RepID=A0A165H4L8_9BASI|nr:hypothetical protein CALCODRAFT_222232 [Calocera cornea HHB12733]
MTSRCIPAWRQAFSPLRCMSAPERLVLRGGCWSVLVDTGEATRMPWCYIKSGLTAWQDNKLVLYPPTQTEDTRSQRRQFPVYSRERKTQLCPILFCHFSIRNDSSWRRTNPPARDAVDYRRYGA